MTTTAGPAPILDTLFGDIWPERNVAGRPRVLLGALGAGTVAAVVLPYRNLGIGTFLVFALIAAVVGAADPALRTRGHAAALTLCLALGSMVFVRDAEWVAVLSVLAAITVAVTTLVPGRSFVALAFAAFAVPFAGIRGLPWLGRSIVSSRSGALSWAVVRTVVLSLLLAVVFGALFASADALFAEWVSFLVPDLTLDSFGLRAVVLVLVGGVTLAFAYVALNPPQSAAVSVEPRRVSRSFEWLLPLAVVDGLFAVFVVAQLTVLFGGHDYLDVRQGITYAEHVHQGFAQMTVATALTLAVVGVTARKARREDTRLLRLALGLLCLLALVVVASAIYRMHVYEEAYGFTQLRLLVTVFEGWLGLLLILVLIAGIAMRGSWLPMASVVSGALTVLGLALLNPDAYIASHNIDRYEETGKIDYDYLAGLSADATPELRSLPGAVECPTGDDWLEWNLGRARAC